MIKYIKTATESQALASSNADAVYFTTFRYTEGNETKERRCIIMGGKKYSEYTETVNDDEGSGS